MFSVTVCNCPQNTPDPACLWAVSSRPSDQQQKKPDGRMCWASSVERRLDDCWPNAGAGGKQCPKLVRMNIRLPHSCCSKVRDPSQTDSASESLDAMKSQRDLEQELSAAEYEEVSVLSAHRVLHQLPSHCVPSSMTDVSSEQSTSYRPLCCIRIFAVQADTVAMLTDPRSTQCCCTNP